MHSAYQYVSRCPEEGCTYQVTSSWQNRAVFSDPASDFMRDGAVVCTLSVPHSCSQVVERGNKHPSCAYTPGQLKPVVSDLLRDDPRIKKKVLLGQLGKVCKISPSGISLFPTLVNLKIAVPAISMSLSQTCVTAACIKHLSRSESIFPCQIRQCAPSELPSVTISTRHMKMESSFCRLS